MRDVDGGPDVEVTTSFPTKRDAELFEDMLEMLEMAGSCQYSYHLLGVKLFGSLFTYIDEEE